MKKISLRYCVLAALFYFSITLTHGEVSAGSCNIEVKTSAVGNGSIEYLQVGKGLPILLLHGLFAQKEQWSEMACYLSRAGYWVIAPDLPGYGKSVHFPIVDYKLENQVGILYQFTGVLNIQKFDIAGSSMGGAIASMYARTHSQQIRSLAFIGAPLGVSGWSTQVKSALYQGINPFIPTSLDQLNLEMQLLFYKPPVLSEAIQQGLISDYQKQYRHYQQVWDIVNLYLYEIDKNSPSPIPALILWGKEDGIFESINMRRLEQKYPKNRHLIVKDASHLLMLEKPAEVADTYIRFLKAK